MIRVIGLGSPFGDDRVGWRVIQLLNGRLPGTVDLVALDRPGSTLINWMGGIEHLVLIDAVRSGAKPGELIRLDPAELDSGGTRLTSHDLALAETLHLAAALGSLPPLVDIYGVEINGCTDQHLSDVAEVAATRLASILAGLGR